MYEVTTGRTSEALFLYHYALGYFDYFSVLEEATAPVIENIGAVPAPDPPTHPYYEYVSPAFRLYLALTMWPSALPRLPDDILVRIAPFVKAEGHRSLMSLLRDKQLELVYEWQREVVANGGPRQQEVPLRTLHDLLYVFDEVLRNFYTVDELIDPLFEAWAAFKYGIEDVLDAIRLHYLDLTTLEDGEGEEAVYCDRYDRLLDEWEKMSCEAEPSVRHAYKGGGFSCMTS